MRSRSPPVAIETSKVSTLGAQKGVGVTYSGARGDAPFARTYAQHDAFGHPRGGAGAEGND